MARRKTKKQNSHDRGACCSPCALGNPCGCSNPTNPYQGDAFELAQYRKKREEWERKGRRGPPPVPPSRRHNPKESTCVGKADMRDAHEVLKDMIAYERKFQFYRLPSLEDLNAQRCNVQDLPLSKIKTWGDYGRRPKGKSLDKPIVVAKYDSKLVVLDGQHRVITLQEKGKKTVSGVVIELTTRRNNPEVRQLKTKLLR